MVILSSLILVMIVFLSQDDFLESINSGRNDIRALYFLDIMFLALDCRVFEFFRHLFVVVLNELAFVDSPIKLISLLF